ncbi:unnamed protein product [Allacma fusca]|uniref:Reelin domain-containing protein n=1 Tax=Allacma fusca TaxID=39272 RepID=A0A8J2PY19_9HEXA|nr:unnamed protein product [Allacma fusca]
MISLKSTLLIATLVIFYNTVEIHSYSSGAPATDELCESMKPQHGADPQTSPSPYAILLSQDTVNPGQKIRVTIKAKDGDSTDFLGFLIIGKRLSNLNEKASKGTFILENEASKNTKTTDCFGITASSITHTNNQPKKEVTFEWQAPLQEGEYVLVGTVVKSFTVFWTQIKSATITVKGQRRSSSSSSSKRHHKSKSVKSQVLK